MAKLTIGDKAQRVLLFLLGVRNARARRSLAAYGFDDAALAEGWRRLQALTASRLDFITGGLDPTLVADLDAWENQWFPICEVVLRTNFPAVHEVVFRNLAQTSGPEVVVSVSTLLDRLDQIAKPADEGGLGNEGKRARKLLDKRGLNERVIGQARQMLSQIGTLEELPDPAPSDDSPAAEEIEQELWNWYLEWSGIARIAIRDRRVLRALGFLRAVRKPNGEIVDEVVPEEDVNAGSEPATQPAATPTAASPVLSSPFVTEPATDE